MRQAKKLICLALCAIMAFSTLAFYAGAVDAHGYKYVLTYDDEKETLKVDIVNIGEMSMAGRIGIEYNTEALTLLKNDGSAEYDTSVAIDTFFATLFTFGKDISGLQEGAVSTTSVTDFVNIDDGRIYCAWAAYGAKNLTDGDTVATLLFKVKDNADLDAIASDGDLIKATETKPSISAWKDTNTILAQVEDANGQKQTAEFGFLRSKTNPERVYPFTVEYEYAGIDPDIKEKKVTITVKDENGTAISGASVKLGNEPTTTNANGVAEFEVSLGIYAVSAEKSGYVSASKSVEVKDVDVEVEITLLMLKAPDAPEDIKLSDFTSSAARITWSKPEADGNSAVTDYIISYGTSATADDKNVKVGSGSVLTKKLTGLSAKTTYYFKVAAINAVGTGTYSEIVSGTTSAASTGGTGGTSGGSSGGSGGGSTVPSTTYYIVTYNISGGKIVSGSSNENVESGKSPSKAPTVEAPEGATFLGWSKDGKTVIALSSIKVGSNLTLTAVYSYDTVHKAYLTGYSDGTAKPEKSITRAEAVTIISRVFDGFDANTAYPSTGFSDVKADNWATNYINFAVSQSLVNGYTDGTFLPSKNITREEFAAIIVRLGKFEQIKTNDFTDVPENHWAVGYIGALTAKGIIKGMGDGTFGLGVNITRAEAVTMLNRYLGREPDATLVSDYYSGKDYPATDIKDHWACFNIIEAMDEHSASTYHK